MRCLKSRITFRLPKIHFHKLSSHASKTPTMAEPAEDMVDFVDTPPPGTNDATPTTSPSKKPSPSPSRPPASKNAFTELMKPKPKKLPKKDLLQKANQIIKGRWRGALIEYIDHPERFPSQVLRVTENTVLIKDLYPKATVHLLLLPRSPSHYLLHPHDAFSDPEFLAMMRQEAASAAKLAAAELSRIIGPFSASNKIRDEAMSKGEVPYDSLPAGRDFMKEIKIGIHAHPSMAHLHVHIISRDMRSDKVKHRKHYQSFTTDFLVELDAYPLSEDDKRREVEYQNNNLKERELVCWRCGKGFGHRFKELKAHLEDEFEEWKKE
ncbi:HIT-like domain-containing protein [Cladorrhinum sp. PSN259]|nr:HIT-like domain-containing protein [Cladorrhinum sp. PSN259]